MQSLRDKTKRLKQWSDHRKYRNKTKQLIRQAKRKYFSNSLTNSKDTKSLWKHLRDVNNGGKTASSNLPETLIIGNETITESEAVASKLNKYFASVAELLNENTSSGSSLDFDTNKISDFVDSKVPTNTQFTIPFITSEQVLLHINTLEASKSTGLDGIGPRIIKLAAQSLSPSIAMLIDKSIATGQLPSQMKLAKVLQFTKVVKSPTPQTIGQFLSCPLYLKFSEST